MNILEQKSLDNFVEIVNVPEITNEVCKNTVEKIAKSLKVEIDVNGDMNINIIGIKENNNGYLNLLSENQYVSFINVYTKLPIGFNHACLDHIFTNGNDYLMTKINAGVILTDITDHCTICTG